MKARCLLCEPIDAGLELVAEDLFVQQQDAPSPPCAPISTPIDVAQPGGGEERDESRSGEEEEEFEAERIIGKKVHRGKPLYLVRWKGCGKEDDSLIALVGPDSEMGVGLLNGHLVVGLLHLSLYIILLLCFFSKRALLGKGDPHRTLGGFIQGGSSWYPGVGRLEFVYHSLALLLLKGCFARQGGPTPDTWVVHTRSGQPVFLPKKNGLSPGVGRTTRFFTKKKRAVKPIFKKNGLLTRFFTEKKRVNSPFSL